METKFITKVKERFDNAYNDFQRKNILKDAVKDLRKAHYNDNEIKELFKTSLLSGPTSEEMIKSNTKFVELLYETLNSDN